jgi:VIT1/CCC1 family predicted Fe2+/Mn2+ transporter
VIYGGTDGIITIFAVVAGVSGASLSSGILLILGVATLFADALSMSVSDYLSSTAEEETTQSQRRRWIKEYDSDPYSTQQDLRRIFRNKGFSEEEIESLTKIVSTNREMTVDLILMDTQAEEEGVPHISAVYTFCSFVFFGFIPLVIDILLLSFTGKNIPENIAFWTGTCLTMVTLFILGVLKAKLTKESTLISGMQMVLIGGAAALVAYVIAFFLATLENDKKD